MANNYKLGDLLNRKDFTIDQWMEVTEFISEKLDMADKLEYEEGEGQERYRYDLVGGMSLWLNNDRSIEGRVTKRIWPIVRDILDELEKYKVHSYVDVV